MIPETKKLILRILKAANGTPIPQNILLQAIEDGFVKKPLESEIRTAIDELLRGDFITQTKDEITEIFSYGLTTKGEIKAKQL